MTETGNWHFLKPLPSDHQRPLSWLTCLFVPLTPPHQRNIWVAGTQFFLMCPEPAGLLSVCSSPSVIPDQVYESILHLASQSWGDACQKSSQLGHCSDHTLLNWLIPLLPTNLIFRDDFTFFYIQEFNTNISLCNMITEDNSPVWTGRTLPYLFQHHTGYWMSGSQHHFVQYLVQNHPI